MRLAVVVGLRKAEACPVCGPTHSDEDLGGRKEFTPPEAELTPQPPPWAGPGGLSSEATTGVLGPCSALQMRT